MFHIVLTTKNSLLLYVILKRALIAEPTSSGFLHVTIFFITFQATDIKVVDVDFNSEFVSRMIPKINYSALYEAAQSVSFFKICVLCLSIV